MLIKLSTHSEAHFGIRLSKETVDVFVHCVRYTRTTAAVGTHLMGYVNMVRWPVGDTQSASQSISNPPEIVREGGMHIPRFSSYRGARSSESLVRAVYHSKMLRRGGIGEGWVEIQVLSHQSSQTTGN